MRYRKLGNTGLEVSVLSFGASSLGSMFREVNEEQGIKAVHVALELGINYFDVSPYYGLTTAETLLGKALSTVDRDRYILSTKAGRYGKNEFDFSAERIIASVDESLQRLQTDYVDILLLHDIEFEAMDVIVNESIPALQQLKDAGKIRFGGVSGLPLEVFQSVLNQTHVDVVLSYCHYALNDNTLLTLIPLLAQKDVALINASPLSMGLLSDRPVPEWHPASPEIRAVCEQAAAYCREQGSNLSKLAIQYAVSEERIPTTLVSTSNPDNIRRNIEWLSEPLDSTLLKQVQAILKPIHNKTWPSGRPEYNQNLKF